MSDNRTTAQTPQGVFLITPDSVEVANSPNSHQTLASEIAALFTFFIRRPQTIAPTAVAGELDAAAEAAKAAAGQLQDQ